MKCSTFFKYLLLAALLAIVGFGVLMASMPGGGLWQEMGAGIAAIMLGPALAAMMCAFVLERGRMVGLMWSGVAAAMASMLGWIGLYVYVSLTWNDVETPAKWLAVVSLWAFMCLMTALLVGARRTAPAAMITGRVTLGAASLLSLMILLGVLTDGEALEDAWRFFALLIILTVSGTLLTLVLQRLRQLAGDLDASPEQIVRLPLLVWCPRCEAEQTITTGGALCQSCGLSIKVMAP